MIVEFEQLIFYSFEVEGDSVMKTRKEWWGKEPFTLDFDAEPIKAFCKTIIKGESDEFFESTEIYTENLRISLLIPYDQFKTILGAATNQSVKKWNDTSLLALSNFE